LLLLIDFFFIYTKYLRATILLYKLLFGVFISLNALCDIDTAVKWSTNYTPSNMRSVITTTLNPSFRRKNENY
jgi:hypothetical protein